MMAGQPPVVRRGLWSAPGRGNKATTTKKSKQSMEVNDPLQRRPRLCRYLAGS